MARAIGQIEQELAALTKATEQLAQDFQAAYQDYLTAFSQAARQQMIQAAYHICTHGYPEPFLQLSLSDRQALQKNLRQLAHQIQTQLVEQLQPVQPLGIVSPSSASDDLWKEIENTNKRESANERQRRNASPSDNDMDEDDDDDEEDNDDDDEDDLPEFDLDDDRDSATILPVQELTLEELDRLREMIGDRLESLQLGGDDESGDPSLRSAPILKLIRIEPEIEPETIVEDRSLTPLDIARWQEKLERSLVKQLQTLSDTTNKALQQAGVLPRRMPKAVLEVAAKTDLSSEVIKSPPNVMSLMIETDLKRRGSEANTTQIMAVRLRLAEIEIGDMTISVLRSRIRDLLSHLSKLKKEYQKKTKERAIAEAEAAWRSSWFED